VKADLIRIGNSRGVRIPKAIIEECRLDDTVEMRVEENRLVISSHRKPREGWEEALRRATPAQQDELLLDSARDDQFEREEWKW